MDKELAIAKVILGKRIRKDRKKLGLSQEKLAEEVGLTDRQIRRIESGEHFPSVPTLYHLYKVLDWKEDAPMSEIMELVKQSMNNDEE